MWIAPIAIWLVVGLVFLAANLTPRVQYGITAYPHPNSGDPVVSTAERTWGWPRAAKKDLIIEYGEVTGPLQGPQWSLEHFADRGHRQVVESRYSVGAGLCNLAVLMSGVMLVVVLFHAARRRRFTLQAMLGATSAFAVLIAIVVRHDPVATWDPLLFDWWKTR